MTSDEVKATICNHLGSLGFTAIWDRSNADGFYIGGSLLHDGEADQGHVHIAPFELHAIDDDANRALIASRCEAAANSAKSAHTFRRNAITEAKRAQEVAKAQIELEDARRQTIEGLAGHNQALMEEVRRLRTLLYPPPEPESK